MQSELKNKVFNGIIWKSTERVLLNLLNLVLPLYLARILEVADFGVIAIMSVFINISNTLINNGLCNAIIQKKDSNEVDKSTVFWIQVGLAVVLYAIIFAISPFVADFYNIPEITSMLRVMSLSFVIGSFAAMQTTELNRTMQFKKSFVANFVSTVVYGTCGIVLGKLGYGAWSLVFANVLNKLALCLCLTVAIRWWPRLVFSFKSFKRLFSYSWKLGLGWLIGTLHQDAYTMVIGKVFNKTTLGYYSKSQTFPNLFSKTATEIVSGVIFPAISKVQDNKEQVKEFTRTLMATMAFIACPIMAGLSGVATNLVIVVLKAKWLPIVPLLRIFCISFGINMLSNANMQPLNAIGRSDIFLKFETIKRGISILLLIIVSFAFENITLVACIVAFMGFVSLCMNAYINRKLLNYRLFEQLFDILPVTVFALIMFAVVYVVGLILPFSPFVSLIIQVLTGAVIYLALCFVFKIKSLKLVVNIIKNKLLKRSN